MNDVQKDFIRTRNQLQSLYQEASKKLDEKKDKLFISGKTESWELAPNMRGKVDELLKNKVEALKHMLVGESEQVKTMGMTFGVFNKYFYE